MEGKLIDVLRGIGLTEGESKTYIALLSIGTSTVGPIIENSGVSASKVYLILDKLVHKGLVTMIVQGGNKLFTAAQPERILDFLEEEKRKIEKDKNHIEEIMPQLKIKSESVSKQPVVEITRGRKGFEMLYNEAIDVVEKDTFYLGLAGRVVTFKAQSFWPKQSEMLEKKNIKKCIIYEQHAWYKKDPDIAKRHIRKGYYPIVLDEKYSYMPQISTIGDRMLLSDIGDDGELFTLIIRSKNLTNSFRKLLMIIKDSGTVPEGFEEMKR